MKCKYCELDIRLENGRWLDNTIESGSKTVSNDVWQQMCPGESRYDLMRGDHIPDKEENIKRLLDKIGH